MSWNHGKNCTVGEQMLADFGISTDNSGHVRLFLTKQEMLFKLLPKRRQTQVSTLCKLYLFVFCMATFLVWSQVLYPFFHCFSQLAQCDKKWTPEQPSHI